MLSRQCGGDSVDVFFAAFSIAVTIFLEQHVQHCQLCNSGGNRTKLERTFVRTTEQHHVCQLSGRGIFVWSRYLESTSSRCRTVKPSQAARVRAAFQMVRFPNCTNEPFFLEEEAGKNSVIFTKSKSVGDSSLTFKGHFGIIHLLNN